MEMQCISLKLSNMEIQCISLKLSKMEMHCISLKLSKMMPVIIDPMRYVHLLLYIHHFKEF